MHFSDYKKPCENVGGILKIWIQNACDVTQDIEQELSFVKNQDTFVVPSEFAEYQFTRESANIEESELNNRNGKLTLYKLKFDIAKATLQNEIEIDKLRRSDKVIVIVQDNNRIYRVFGSKCNPCTVKAAYNSGKSYGNQNIYSVEIENAEIKKPFRLPLPADPPRPKKNLIVRSFGAEGYVKVEFLGDTYYVDPETQEEFFVPVGEDYKITRSIVNPDTGNLDINRIDISFPNYKFPPRIVSATFDGLAENGIVNASNPDQGSIKILREHTKTMQNVSSSVMVEIEFRDVEIFADFDSENTSSILTQNGIVESLSDRLGNLTPMIQNTPSLRPVIIGNRIRLQNNQILNTGDNGLVTGKPTKWLKSYYIGSIAQLDNGYFHVDTQGTAYGYWYIDVVNDRFTHGNGGTISNIGLAPNTPFMLYNDINSDFFCGVRYNGNTYSFNDTTEGYFPEEGAMITARNNIISDFNRLLILWERLTIEEYTLIEQILMQKYNVI